MIIITACNYVIVTSEILVTLADILAHVIATSEILVTLADILAYVIVNGTTGCLFKTPMHGVCKSYLICIHSSSTSPFKA